MEQIGPGAGAYAEQRRLISTQMKETLVDRLGLGRRADEIPDDCRLYGVGLGLDSVDALEIAVAVESHFGVAVEADDLARRRSVNSVVDLITERLHERPESPPESPEDDYWRLRTRAGLADLGAWARIEVSGRGASATVDAVIGESVQDLFEGRCAHTLIPSETGGVEAIVCVITLGESYHVVAEPEEHNTVMRALEAAARGRDAVVRDVRAEKFALALVGPRAMRIAHVAFGEVVHTIDALNAIAAVGLTHGASGKAGRTAVAPHATPIGKLPAIAARPDYFGEYELHLLGPAAEKEAVIEQLERASGDEPLRVGTTALATMMTEMGTFSRARDVPDGTSVFEAGLEWMIDFRKRGLRAAEALERAKATVRRRCVLMTMDGHAGGLRGQAVRLEGQEIGWIQSAVDSYTLKGTVALAYLDERFGIPGLKCAVGDEERPAATVSAPAFLSQSTLDKLSRGTHRSAR